MGFPKQEHWSGYPFPSPGDLRNLWVEPRSLALQAGFSCAQVVKNPSAMESRETWIRSLGWEDPLEKGTDTHSSILAWRIPWTASSMESQRVGHN